jgi:HAD superfamily 5'-nucleotidase-like hydrolase
MIGRGKVDSILKYDGIGFDMDHTFIRYKMRSFVKIIYECSAIFLVSKKNYPQEVFPIDDSDAKEKFKMYFRAVFDHRNGNILKIGSNNLIMRGYNGFRMMTTPEIIAAYGKNPVIKDYDILSNKHKDFTNLHEFYGASQVPILAQIVSLKNSGKFPILNEKTYYNIIADIFEGNEFNFAIPSIENFYKKEFSGFFFPKFLSEPRHYIHKCSKEMLEKLKILKSKGIKIFIVSNAYYQVADMMMREAVGLDWLDYFDFVSYHARKPSFFNNNDNPPLFTNIKGDSITNFDEFMNKEKTGDEKVVIGGHAHYINSYMRTQIKKEFKILFFGDTIVSDCVYAFDKLHDKNWEIVLILEELQELENGYQDKEYYNYWTYWGSALQDKNIYSGVDKTIIFDFADNIAHRSFSMLDSKEALEFLTI